jgi:hypothetical protein
MQKLDNLNLRGIDRPRPVRPAPKVLRCDDDPFVRCPCGKRIHPADVDAHTSPKASTCRCVAVSPSVRLP